MIKIFAIICAITNLVNFSIHLLVIFGAPMSEYTYGGVYMDNKVLPKKQRLSSIFSAFILLLISILYSYIGGLHLKFLDLVDVKYFALIFVMFMVLNAMMSFASKSKKEKMFILPIQLIGIISGVIVCLNI